MNYLAWAAGRNDTHRPSWGELFLLAEGVGTPQHVTNLIVPRGRR